MRKIATNILLIPFAVAGGLFYGLIADRIFKNREPWFTSFMIFGLALSICIMTWLFRASHTLAVWVFIGTSAFYLVARFLFGKGSALEMFFAPHFTALMILMLQPALERAHEKARLLQEQRPNTSLEPTPHGRVSNALEFISGCAPWVRGGSAFVH